MKIKKNIKTGFTLIELLVVIAILGILATIGLGSYTSTQAKSRDARRKSDLENVQKALEMYLNDFGSYPEDDSGSIADFDWGQTFRDPDKATTIYMKELPQDPVSSQNYYYVSGDSWYKLYARLENSNDICFSNNSFCKSDGFLNTNCGSGSLCNYIAPSSNVTEYDN